MFNVDASLYIKEWEKAATDQSDLMHFKLKLGTKSVSPLVRLLYRAYQNFFDPRIRFCGDTGSGEGILVISGETHLVDLFVKFYSSFEDSITDLAKKNSTGDRSVTISLKRKYYNDFYIQAMDYSGVNTNKEKEDDFI